MEAGKWSEQQRFEVLRDLAQVDESPRGAATSGSASDAGAGEESAGSATGVPDSSEQGTQTAAMESQEEMHVRVLTELDGHLRVM